MEIESTLKSTSSPAALAVQVAREVAVGAATEAACAEAAERANAAIAVASNARAAAVLFAAREAADTARVVAASPQPRWLRCDVAANHAGHAARWAGRAAGDKPEGFLWQQRRLAALILESNASEWASDERIPGTRPD